jgi:peptidoglycan/xylan/chitin deacetylase (PgdA/CDA1 family)
MLRCVICCLWLLASWPAFSNNAVVLMYHRFGEERFPSTNIRIKQFEAHLEHLREAKYNVVPLADVLEAVSLGDPLPERSVAITIDDAYASIYSVAWPMLADYGFPATVFVATDPVDAGLPAYMDWEQMRELQAAGIRFANHGASHASYLDLSLDEVRADVEQGARRLGEELDPLAEAFAYPNGEYDTERANLLRELGYIAFTQQSGGVAATSDTRILPRFPMAEAFGNISEFRIKVASLPLPVKSIEPWDPVVRNNPPGLTIELGPSVARLGELSCFVSRQGRVNVDWQNGRTRFSVQPARDLAPGRHRVNCTAPRNDGRYEWFSHPWFVILQ